MLGLVPFLVVTLFFLYSHGKDLTTQTSNHLVSVRNIKKTSCKTTSATSRSRSSTSPSRTLPATVSVASTVSPAPSKLGTTPQEARARAQARYVPGSWDKLQQPDSQVEIEPSIGALILADEMYGRVHQRFHRGYADMVRKSNLQRHLPGRPQR